MNRGPTKSRTIRKRPAWARNGYSRRQWYALNPLTRGLLAALSMVLGGAA